MGVENLKKVLAFVLRLSNKVDEVTQDGIQWTDVLSLLPNLVESVGVLKVGKTAWAEFNDLDDLERDDVLGYVKNEFDIADEKLEGVVESAFEFIFAAGDLVEKVKDAVAK